jgi:thiamine-phosphate pyrophosphorylase
MARTLTKHRRRYKDAQYSHLPDILVMTDDHRLPDPVAVARAIPPTWGLIFRHYDSQERETLARLTARVCRSRGVAFFVAGDWRLADRVRADGVHLPEGLTGSMPMAPFLLWRRRRRLISMSAHGARGLRRVHLFKVDAVVLSPVEATESHDEKAPLGRHRFSALVRSTVSPVFALGGMTLAHYNGLTALGAAGLAGIGLAKSFGLETEL